MDRTSNDLMHLFSQLGLACDEPSMNRFIDTHNLKPTELLENASFWTDSQRAFLLDAQTQDAEWTETIDQLNTLLHK